MKPKNGYVYAFFDKNRGITKIGRASNPSVRIRAIATQGAVVDYESFHIKTGDYYKVELCCHRELSEFRIEGTEWFNVGIVTAKRIIQKNAKSVIEITDSEISIDGLVFGAIKRNYEMQSEPYADALEMGSAAFIIDGKYCMVNAMKEVNGRYDSIWEMLLYEHVGAFDFCIDSDIDPYDLEYIYFRNVVGNEDFVEIYKIIRDGIAADMPYKDIFQLCKNRVMSISQQLLT